jgi:hypothetical protein
VRAMRGSVLPGAFAPITAKEPLKPEIQPPIREPRHSQEANSGMQTDVSLGNTLAPPAALHSTPDGIQYHFIITIWY